ncbi:hypothetical protein GCM10009767_10840 [Kocuria aegyptia]|uniref:Uncharacterized protein n=1 Tax=Kocuria aegyptia TaxID=330943 RepID=A0ABN2KDI6_9MICC
MATDSGAALAYVGWDPDGGVASEAPFPRRQSSWTRFGTVPPRTGFVDGGGVETGCPTERRIAVLGDIPSHLPGSGRLPGPAPATAAHRRGGNQGQ